MGTENQLTVRSYHYRVGEYVDGTVQEVSGTVKEWLDQTFVDVPKDANILEFGSAFGRDATYLQEQGYQVACTDATPAFVDLLRQKGISANILNAINDELPQGIDVVLANAVLLHFTRDETEAVIAKVHGALKPGGKFAFTLKQGEGEKWSDDKLGAPRYFVYWTDEQIRAVLESAGFSDVNVWGDRATENSTWLQIIAKKTEA